MHIKWGRYKGSISALAFEDAGVGGDIAVPALFFAPQDNRRTPLPGARVVYALCKDPRSQVTMPVFLFALRVVKYVSDVVGLGLRKGRFS